MYHPLFIQYTKILFLWKKNDFVDFLNISDKIITIRQDKNDYFRLWRWHF